jgi:hypothetical protein
MPQGGCAPKILAVTQRGAFRLIGGAAEQAILNEGERPNLDPSDRSRLTEFYVGESVKLL